MSAPDSLNSNRIYEVRVPGFGFDQHGSLQFLEENVNNNAATQRGSSD